MVTVAMILKHACSLPEKAMTNIDSILKSRDVAFSTKVHLVNAMVFQWSLMDVRIGLYKESLVPKN